jgi:aspartate carbamoyltransferase catalytic subunit
MKHLLSVDDLGTRAELESMLELTDSFLEVTQRDIPKVPALRGKTVVSLFYEDSTRTRLSFESAAKRLSADTMTFSVSTSSVKKGESLRDTVQTIDAMGIDAIVVRHGAAGAPNRVAQWSGASVINAGDGSHEHPTQALLDAFTLRRHRGPSLDGCRVAIVGDVKHSRVARSNVKALQADPRRTADLDAGTPRRLAGCGEPRPRRRTGRDRCCLPAPDSTGTHQ